MREPAVTDTAFRVDNDGGHKLLEVTHLPLLPRALDDGDFRPVKLYRCGQCERTSSDDAWSAAWWSERSRRMTDPEYTPEPGETPHPTTHSYGLDDRMVCPRCRYVHADDDNSWVEEVAGLAIEIERNVSGGDRG